MKIVLYTKDSRLMASPRHSGQGFVAIRHGGAPSGVAAFIVPDGESGKNPRIIAEYYDLV